MATVSARVAAWRKAAAPQCGNFTPTGNARKAMTDAEHNNYGSNEGRGNLNEDSEVRPSVNEDLDAKREESQVPTGGMGREEAPNEGPSQGAYSRPGEDTSRGGDPEGGAGPDTNGTPGLEDTPRAPHNTNPHSDELPA